MFMTPTQSEVLAFVRAFRVDHGYSPTLDEMSAFFGRSRVTLYEHLQALVKKGALRHTRNAARSYEPTGFDMEVCPTCGRHRDYERDVLQPPLDAGQGGVQDGRP